jgi:hypothetical protein
VERGRGEGMRSARGARGWGRRRDETRRGRDAALREIGRSGNAGLDSDHSRPWAFTYGAFVCSQLWACVWSTTFPSVIFFYFNPFRKQFLNPVKTYSIDLSTRHQPS